MGATSRGPSDLGARSSASGEHQRAPFRDTEYHQAPFRADGLLQEDDEEEGQEQWWQGWWQSNSEWSEDTWRTKEYEPPTSWDTSSDIFIPEFLAGFLLLHRSGLDAHERANMMAAIRGEFSLLSVSCALREQWGDEDLQKRDRLKSDASALWAEDEEDHDLQGLMADDGFDGIEAMSPEDQEAYMTEQDKVETALAAIQAQKATLREARWKQKQMKLGRGFFPPKPFQRAGQDAGGQRSSSGQKLCFRCGGPHLIAIVQSPPSRHELLKRQLRLPLGLAMEKEESSLFGQQEEGLAADETVHRCYGVIDSGATSSLASVDALEQVMKANVAMHGATMMEVDTSRRPTFRFGNGFGKTVNSHPGSWSWREG